MRPRLRAFHVVRIFSCSLCVSGVSKRCVTSSGKKTTVEAAAASGFPPPSDRMENTLDVGVARNNFVSEVQSNEDDQKTELSSSSSSRAAAVVGATSLLEEPGAPKPIDMSAVATMMRKKPLARRRQKFSFLSTPDDRLSCDISPAYAVPNNTSKPLLPMWASSLTSPQLGKQRLRAENWISTDSMGTLPHEYVVQFLVWLHSRLSSKENAPFLEQLMENVEFHLRSQYARGLIARKTFNAGDVIFTIPLPDTIDGENSCGSSTTAETDVTTWGLVLNSETLRRYSLTAQRRGAPSYAAVEAVVSVRKSSFDPIPHCLFVDQVYCAVLLACERAEGERSTLYPYLRLFAPFDDDLIRELHLGVLDPATHLEYSDHCSRFDHYLRQIHKKWMDEYVLFSNVDAVDQSFDVCTGKNSHGVDTTNGELLTDDNSLFRLPPPSMEDMRWALRVVLSRQRLLPLRNFVEPFVDVCTEDKWMRKKEDMWTRLVTSLQLGIMDHLLGVVDRTRTCANDFEPQTIASVLPVVDMMQHPPGGVANTEMRIERIPVTAAYSSGGTQSDKSGPLCAVVRASSSIEEGSELTSLYPRCYSLSYTLYRFGFLPLRRREDDAEARSSALNT